MNSKMQTTKLQKSTGKVIICNVALVSDIVHIYILSQSMLCLPKANTIPLVNNIDPCKTLTCTQGLDYYLGTANNLVN